MVKLVLGGDGRGAVKAIQDLNKAIAGTEKTLDTTAKKAAQLEKQGKRIGELADPMKKYNRQMAELAQHVKDGRVSMEDARQMAIRHQRQLQGLGTTGTKAFGGIAASLRSTVAGLASVGGAIALVRSELAAIRAESERVTQSHLSAAQSRDVLKRNIAVLPAAQRRTFLARANKLAQTTALPQTAIDTGLAEAFSGTGGDIEATFATASLAAQVQKTSPEAIGEYAGSLADISKATKDKSALRNLGFLLTVGAASRVADAKKQAATIPGALAGAGAFGASAETSGALFSALSVAAADTEGRRSGTGVIRLAEQLSSFFGDRGDLGTFTERMGALRKDPALAKEFYEGASFEAKVKGPIREFLLDPESAVAQNFRRAKGGFGTAATQKALGQSTIGFLGEGGIAATAETERVISSTMEQMRLGSDATLSEKASTDLIELISQARGQPRFVTRATTALTSGLEFDRAEAIWELREAKKMVGSVLDGREINPELLDKMDGMISELQRIESNQHQGATAARQE